MPRLWTDTIDAHRRVVRDAILDAAGDLVAEDGLLSVTMSRIAEGAGIGRATLYKYFPDVEAVLLAWHERQVAGHLEQLRRVRDEARGAGERLGAVLEAYAFIRRDIHRHADAELVTLMHRHAHVGQAQQQVREMVRDLLADAVSSGHVRSDVPPEELAAYCLHALAAADQLRTKAAVRRLVTVVLTGLHPSG